jgi:hypothetical protein
MAARGSRPALLGDAAGVVRLARGMHSGPEDGVANELAGMRKALDVASLHEHYQADGKREPVLFGEPDERREPISDRGHGCSLRTVLRVSFESHH